MSCSAGANLLASKASHMNLLAKICLKPSTMASAECAFVMDPGPYKCLPRTAHDLISK